MFVYSFDEFKERLEQSGEKPFNGKKIGITIGSFDGVHLGHKAILSNLTDYCKKNDYYSVVITFSNPLTMYKQNDSYIGDVYSFKYKMVALKKLGIDYVIYIDFTPEFSKMTGEEFFDIFYKNYNLKYIVEGTDFSCGYEGATNMQRIQAYCKKNKIECDFIEPISIVDKYGESTRISSSLIRKYIAKSDFRTINILTNRVYRLDIPKQEEKTLKIDKELFRQVLPQDGIYKCITEHNKTCRVEIYKTFLLLEFPCHILYFDFNT